MTKSRKSVALSSKIDVAIVGGGPAGLSALLWARKLGLQSLLFDRETRLGGQLNSIYNHITDYPGRTTRNGAEMLRHFMKSLGNVHGSLLLGTEVGKLDVKNLELCVDPGRSIRANAIVLATGVRRRKLKIPGEQGFAGKGILTSGAKQWRSTKGKLVAIVGGGDAAFENALILSAAAKRVYLIHRRSEFTARPEFVSQVRRDRRIELVTNTVLTEIRGNDRLRSIQIKDNASGEIRQLPVDALLVRIGVEPNSELVREQIKLDRSGYVLVNSLGQTSNENVFAVGDIANPWSPTVATSVGTGAVAILAITRLLKGNGSRKVK